MALGGGGEEEQRGAGTRPLTAGEIRENLDDILIVLRTRWRVDEEKSREIERLVEEEAQRGMEELLKSSEAMIEKIDAADGYVRKESEQFSRRPAVRPMFTSHCDDVEITLSPSSSPVLTETRLQEEFPHSFFRLRKKEFQWF